MSTLITPEVQRYRDCLGSLSPIKVAEQLGTPLHAGQQRIAKYFEAPYVHTWHEATWLISRRWGKTFLGEDIATTLMLTPESKILVVSHSTSLSDVWWKSVLQALLSLPALEGKIEWSKKEGIIEIPELNTSFICCSYLNADSRAIGKSFTHILKDEHFLVPASDQEEIYNLITPTLTNYGSNDGIKYGKQIILSTPRGSATGSHSGITYLKGLNKVKGFISFKHTIYESPFLTSEEIEALKESTSRDSWEQEYMCEFTKTNKTVFRNYDKNKHIIQMSKQQLKDMAQHCELIVGLDVGMVDGNGASLILYNNKRDCYYVIDEHYAKDEISTVFIKRIRDLVGNWCKILNINFNDVIYFYDPSAKAMATEAHRNFNLTLHKAKNNRSEGIDYVNELLQGKGSAQVPRLYILDNCTITSDMLEYAEFKVINGQISNQYAKDNSERQSHFELCDTVRYVTYSHYKTSNNQIIVV